MVNLNTVSNRLAAYIHSSEGQLDIKTAISVYVNAQPQTSNEEVITGMKEDLPIESLYEINVLQGPSTLLRTLHNYPALKRLRYEQHLDSNRVVWGLTRMFYTSNQEGEYAHLPLHGTNGDPQLSTPDTSAANTPPPQSSTK